MTPFTEFWNLIMSLCVLAGMAVSLMLVYAVLFMKTDSLAQKVGKFISSKILWIGLLLSLSAIVSSLVYSEIIGYPPCLFCWWARVFFYPQFVFFAIALWKKDRGILKYSLGLTVLGLCVSTYHYIIETVGFSPLPCEVGGVSCLSRYVYEFGFITIPLMGLIGFLALFLSLLVTKRYDKVSVQ